MSLIKSSQIEEAIDSLKQLTDKYCPLEMLGLIQQMFKAIDEAKREHLGEESPLNSDDIIPIVIFMVIRANVQHLGAEISLLEDLMGGDFDQIIRGYVGYCFTTLEVSEEGREGGTGDCVKLCLCLDCRPHISTFSATSSTAD